VSQVRERLKARKNISVAETGHLEDHQHAILSVVMVANEAAFLRSQLDQISYTISTWASVLILDATIQIARPWDEMPQNQYDDFIDG
jgi:uncharacterized protein YlxP (DUF503 family)